MSSLLCLNRAKPTPDLIEEEPSTIEEDKISAKLDLALDTLAKNEEEEISSLTRHSSATKVSMRECLDESTLEPQIKITSIADLVRIRQEEAKEREKGREIKKNQFNPKAVGILNLKTLPLVIQNWLASGFSQTSSII